MFTEVAHRDIKTTMETSEAGGYREIKAEGSVDFQASKAFWDKVFGSEGLRKDIAPTNFSKNKDDALTEAQEKKSEVDDNGKTYKNGNELLSNNTYELNGNIYKTDEKGRIVDVQAKPTLTPENARDNDAQKEVGGNDRREGDQGGHIIGRDMGGDGGKGNLVAMDSKINQSDYKKMENDIKRELTDEKEVTTHTEISYSGDSERPDKIKVTVTADGKETVYTFDNNIDGSLREKAGEIGGKDAAETVQSVLEEKGGEVSSTKEEYDENGNLEKAMVNVTYTDENGTTQRTRIVIDNPQGGNN